MKAIVLGGCGAVGSNAVKTLVNTKIFSEVLIGDFNMAKAEEMIDQLGRKLSAVKMDATDRASIKKAIAGCDLVVNCIGPFYSTVQNILETVIEAGINYVDVCDDPDVTLKILKLDQAAKDAGILALIGMGASPGVTNLLGKLIADDFLDETDSIDIFHTHGGEPFEGEGVIGHRFHCMSIEIPMFLDGELKYVNYFEKDGFALRQRFDFPMIGNDIPVFPYPHPEQLTMPKYIKLNRVTNKGSVLPIAYYELTSELCRLGFAETEP
jgi:saccharopine dehydrogenase (NAD+, L-lysine-forming)